MDQQTVSPFLLKLLCPVSAETSQWIIFAQSFGEINYKVEVFQP